MPDKTTGAKKPAGPENAKPVKPMSGYDPTTVVIGVIQLIFCAYVARTSHGLVLVVAIVLATLAAAGLIFGPKARRHADRDSMIAKRSMARIRAMRSTPVNADDVFDASPTTDRVSFYAGFGHAMTQVEEQMRRAVTDVDAL